jgi:galactonate dehydratase
MRPDRLRAVTLSIVDASPRTHWIILEIETDSGLRGLGEATLSGHEEAVAVATAKVARFAFELPDCDPAGLPHARPATLPEAAARSAFDQAFWDVLAQRQGLRLADALGAVQRERIPVYANINRRTRERSPDGFAASARAAVASGHTALKVAPFDEVTPDIGRADGVGLLRPGLDRIAAVREVVGPQVRLMVDCHWRLDVPAAEHVLSAAAELGVVWLECPLPETLETIEALAGLRRMANRHGILLAGLETGIGIEGFRPFLSAGSYDVMMPDIKYVGSIAEMLRLADLLGAEDVGFSPHNPSGPIAHAASLHVCAVLKTVHSLEIQYDETPLFHEMIDGAAATTSRGQMTIPAGTGMAVALRRDRFDPSRRWHWTRDRLG